MSFTILANSTPTDAVEVNNNFYHVAQGSRLPMGGTSLAATTLVYDLGTTTAYWNNLYCNNINANSITTANKSLWTLVSEVTLTATASSIEFTGLNGDTDLEYKLIFMFGATNACSAYLSINSDSSTNYGYQWLYVVDTGVSALRTTGATYIFVGSTIPDTATNFYTFSQSILNVKTGINRMIFNTFLRSVISTTVHSFFKIAGTWQDTTSTVSSLKISLSDPINNGNFQLWKRG